MKTLVIVESPTKARTISRFLGSDYEIIASMGHIMDLPKSTLGINLDKDFAPDYQMMADKKKIIAGLSLGVLVTEGAEDSGSLITANEALVINRPAFAIPGPITSALSKAPLKLIEKGGKLVTSAEDILKQLKVQTPSLKTASQSSRLENLSKNELKIVQLLENEGLSFDEIVRRSKLDSSIVASLISMLEIKGILVRSEGFFQLST